MAPGVAQFLRCLGLASSRAVHGRLSGMRARPRSGLARGSFARAYCLRERIVFFAGSLECALLEGEGCLRAVGRRCCLAGRLGLGAVALEVHRRARGLDPEAV